MGIGLPALRGIGLFLDMLSDVVFMVMLILLAQGWAISTHHIEHRLPMLIFAVLFVVLDAILMLVMNYAIDPARNVFMYVTVPGMFVLFLRLMVLAAFAALIIRSIQNEGNSDKRRFFVLLGSIYSLYLVSLPII